MNLKHLYWKIPYNWRLGQLWYRLKCYLWHRYTTVKPRHLDHTWCDRCDLLPHMMFEILSQFIEKECSPGHVEWYGEWGHKIDGKYVRDEMQELYDWWHSIYNKAYHEEDEKLWKEVSKHRPSIEWVPLDDGNFLWDQQWEHEEDKQLYRQHVDASIELEANMEKQLAENLHRIINIMPYMWT